MKRNTFKSLLINILILLGSCLLYFVSGGITQIAAGMLISVMIGYSVTKHHYMFVAAESLLVLASVVSGFMILGGIPGIISGIASGVTLVLLGIGLGLSTNLKMSVSGMVLMSSAIYLVNMVFAFYMVGGNSSSQMLLEDFNVLLNETLTTQYAGSPEIIEMADELISEMMAIFMRFMPAILVCSAGASGLVLTFVYKKIIVKINKNVTMESLSSLKVERIGGVMFIITIIITLSMNDAYIFDALLNLLVILFFVFYICGLSYIDCSMRYKGKNRTFRTIMVIVVIPLVTLLFALPALFVAGVGFADSLVDFRKRHELKGDNDGPQ